MTTKTTPATTVDVPQTGKTVELTRKLREARGNSKQWGEVAEYVRDELLDEIKTLETEHNRDEITAITAGGVKILGVTTTTRKTLDIERLKADHPEIDFDSYMKVNTSTTLRPANF